MVFSHPTFLFLFLPAVLALYALAPRALKNGWLLLASLVFYAFDRPEFALVMLGSIAINWGLGLWVERARERSRTIVAVALVLNLGLLGFFKYWNFLWDNLESLGIGLERFPADPVVLPIGISFFTFQALSYVIDVSRGEGRAQRNPLDFGLYIALFPQLIAGPIVRYRDVAEQIGGRTHSLELFARGVRRFVLGLGKKMLIANVLAEASDSIFALDTRALDASTAWLGALCYTGQIYFDFSGYSDMAIGLGLMFGFRFLENFDYPYIARSVTEFWRRWHISLSSWFRDYLYIPLGGNRVGPVRTYVNLALTMLLGGLWHGASWNFIAWGGYQGFWLIVERLIGKSSIFSFAPRPLQVAGTFVLALFGWVFFRATTMSGALDHMAAMVGAHSDARALLDVRPLHWFTMGLAALVVWLCPTTQSLIQRARTLWVLVLQVLFLLALVHLHYEHNVPFLYFQF